VGEEDSPLKTCLIIDLGLTGYAEALAWQERCVALRKGGAIGDVLFFCEHPHVITLGRSGKSAHVLVSESVLRQKGVEFFPSNRGGDATYHGPGQIVGYPVLNLAEIRRDVAWYVRMLEETMIRASAEWGVTAGREEGKTGVWVANAAGGAEKLGAIGVHLSRWITSHGFAYNVATDLRYFDLIVPCGIAGRKAISLEKLLDREVRTDELRPQLARHFGEIFGLHMKAAALEDLRAPSPEAEEHAALASR
jgi:lipoyl(octanoyl) transferase